MPADSEMATAPAEQTAEALSQQFAEAASALEDLSQIRAREVDEVSSQVSKVAGATTDAGRAVVERLEKKQAEKKREAEMTDQAKSLFEGIQKLAEEMSSNIEEQQGKLRDLQANLDVKGEVVASLESAVTERDALIIGLEEKLKASEEGLEETTLKLDEKSTAFDEKSTALDDANRDLDNAKKSHESTLADANQAHESALAEANQAHETAFAEAKQTHESVFADAKQTHESALAAASEAAGEKEKEHGEEVGKLQEEKEELQKKLGEAEGSSLLMGDTVRTLQADLKKVETELEVKDNSNSAREHEQKVARERWEEEKDQLDELLRKKSANIDELQALIDVISGNEYAAVVNAAPDVVSLPGASPKEDEDQKEEAKNDAAPPESVAAEIPAPPAELSTDEPIPPPNMAAAPNARETIEMNVSDVMAAGDTMPLPGDGDKAPEVLTQEAPSSGSWADSVEMGDNSKDAFWESSTGGGVASLDKDGKPLEGNLAEHPELTLDMVVKATEKLDGADWQSPEEIKLAGVLAHQAWRVEEVAKLTRLDGELVRMKLAEFVRRGLITVVS
ncbi:MAG: hypothetical protein GY822_04360 [Deltaproteobacteria bacterium]|nr:hypothetical protein [Deltaproteobacteria bacterium]